MPPTIFDPLTSPPGSLATTPGGATWTQRRGTFAISGGKLTIAEAPTTSPLATVNLSTGEQEVGADVGIGDAVYFRVADLNNWWRLRLRAVTFEQVSSRTEYLYRASYQTNSGVYMGNIENWNSCLPTHTLTQPLNEYSAGTVANLVACTRTSTTRQVPFTITVQTYEAVQDRCVAGVIAARAWALPAKPSRLRVRAQASSIWSYTDLSPRSLGSAADTSQPQAFVADSTGQTNPHAGIGRGGPTATAAVALRNFGAVPLINEPLAPTLTEPVPGAFVDTDEDFNVSFRFGGVDPGDAMTAYSLRLRFNSLTRWLKNDGTLSATETAATKLVGFGTGAFTVTVPGGLIPLGFDVNWTAKTWGQNATLGAGPLAAEQVFVSNAAPVLILTGPPEVVDTTSRPTATATTTDPESDTIDLARLRLFEADDVTSVNPVADQAVWDSGWVPVTVISGQIALTIGGDVIDLENGKAYVEAMQASGAATAPSNWALRAFRMDISPPAVPIVSAGYESSAERFAVLASVTAQVNQLSERQADLRHGIEGWQAGSPNTTVPFGIEGVGMRVTASGPNDIVVEVTEAIPTIPGQAYTSLAEVALAEGSNVGSWHFETEFSDEEGTVVGIIKGEATGELPTELVAAPPDPPDDAPPEGYALQWATQASAPNMLALQDATLSASAVFVHLAISPPAPPKPITRVEWLWQAQGAGSWTVYRVNDTTAPYNMEADSDGVLLSLFPTDGPFAIRAHVVYNDASDDDIDATFNVHHQAVVIPLPNYSIRVASSPAANNRFAVSQPLLGATLMQPSWVHLGWTESGDDPIIDHVDWYYRAGTAGAWLPARIGTDVNPPYEFQVDPIPSPPLDPTVLGPPGQYQVRCLIHFVNPDL